MKDEVQLKEENVTTHSSNRLSYGGNVTNIVKETLTDESRCSRCINWIKSHIHYLPIFTACYITISFVISYAISVSYGHVEAGFPYISYTAVKPPERGWFSQLVNIGSILMALNVYIRFQILRGIIKSNSPSVRIKRCNLTSLIFGWLSAFGLSMVANYQTVDMRPMHYTGAGLAFGFGVLYCWTQSVLSWKLRNINECRYYHQVAIWQFIFSSILTIFLITFATSKIIYKKGRREGLGTKWDTLQVPYLFSTITEWLTALMGAGVFGLTFIPDFKRFKFIGPSIELKEEQVITAESQIFIPFNNGTAFNNGNSMQNSLHGKEVKMEV